MSKYDEIAKKLEQEFEITVGQMFGKPCLKVNKKAFAAFFKGEMVFKLGYKEVNLLKEKYIGSCNWDPSGKNRPMKDWIQIPIEFQDSWDSLALNAMNYADPAKE